MISRERVGTEIGLMTGRIKKTFRNSKDSITSFQTNLNERTRRAVRKTDYYVHDNAWAMMAISAGLAFAAGFVLSRANQEAIAEAVGELDVLDPRPELREGLHRGVVSGVGDH